MLRAGQSDASGERPSVADEVSAQQLAHEVASLLDGALRCIRLARGRLDPVVTPPPALANLGLATDALERMAALLEGAMTGPRARVAALRSPQNVRDGLSRAMLLLRALADERGVALRWHIDDALAERPCGLLETLVLNGVRNAIEAAARTEPLDRRPMAAGALRPQRRDDGIGDAEPAGGRRTDVSLTLVDGLVNLVVIDTGPGVAATGDAPRGHGLGLPLCRQIAAELGGSLELLDAPDRAGAVLRIVLPVAALEDVRP